MTRSARGVAPTAIVLVAIVALVTACTSEGDEADPSDSSTAAAGSSDTAEPSQEDAGAGAPDGFTTVAHPEARVAVPDDWTEGDPGDLVEADPDVVDRRIPDAPDDQPFGARLNHYDRTEERTFDSAEDPALLQAGLLPPEQEQTRREEVEVAGAEEGFLLQVEAESTLVDEPVRFTYVVGRREDGAAFLLSIVGTEEQVPDDVVETMVETFTLTEPVALPDEAATS